MRISGRLLTVLALTGVAGIMLLIAAQHFDRPRLIGPGLILFAFGSFAAGADAIGRRHTVERSRETTRRRTFEGTGAVLLGLMLVILSLGFAVAGAAFLRGSQQRLLAFLAGRPGFALVPAGLAVAAGGGARLFGARDWNGSLGRFLASLPERFSGTILLLSGLALIGAGMLDILAPAAFDNLIDSWLAPFRQAAG
jgi:hypothetical protein